MFNELRYPNNVHAYLSNLEGLGIFQIRQDIYMAVENIYEPLEANAKTTYGDIEQQVPEKTITFQRGTIEITPFARLLIKACFSTQKA